MNWQRTLITKIILLGILQFFCLVCSAGVGIHTFKNKTDSIIFDLNLNQITYKQKEYMIIENPTGWFWNKACKYKYCTFQCADENFNKIFIRLYDLGVEYKVVITDFKNNECVQYLKKTNGKD